MITCTSNVRALIEADNSSWNLFVNSIKDALFNVWLFDKDDRHFGCSS